MFWRLGFAQTSPVDQLLETGNFTLEQLLEEPDIIQECKQLNKKLIEYLSLPENVTQLIDYVVDDAPEGGDNKVEFIYPYKASEVLASDVNAIYDCMFANEALVDKLFSILEREEPLNPLLAGYFAKIVSTLIARRPEETFQMIKSRNFMESILRHLSTYSILELLLKIVSEVEEASGRGDDFDWLYEFGIIGKLLEKINKDYGEDLHANASAALVGFISCQGSPMIFQSSIPSGQSRFVKDMLEPSAVSQLLEKTLKGDNSTLQHGLTVLVAVMKHCTNANRTIPEQNLEVNNVVSELLNCLDALVQILKNPPPMQPITNTSGTLDPPLGSTRLKILEVIHELVKLRSLVAEEVILKLGVLPVCLDLFIKYEWHSFLHNIVESMVGTVLSGENKTLKMSLFKEGNLLGRIIDATRHNDDAVTQGKNCRKGYMGQLRLIANAAMREAGRPEQEWMSEYVQGKEWVEYVADHLEPSNVRNDRDQLGTSATRRDEEEVDDFVSPEPTINPYDHIVFRPHGNSKEDLFDEDEEEEEEMKDGENEEEGEGDGLEGGFAKLSVTTEEGAGDGEDKIESPEYNDINYWKPTFNWLAPE